MARRKATSDGRKTQAVDPYRVVEPKQQDANRREHAHVFREKGYRCDTDTRGFANAGNRSPLRLVVDASEGFIPLWAKGVTLRWKFRDQSVSHFASPDEAKGAIRDLLGAALLLWGNASPIKFSERNDAWDFEIVVEPKNDCDVAGCVLASAFFPDQGRHQLYIYPMTFTEPKQEQIETLAHELGHVFGLRHFFAQIEETQWRSEIFGKHRPFSIMNYGAKSVMTRQDRSDLKTLYTKAWSGDLTNINGTPIKFVKPYHTT